MNYLKTILTESEIEEIEETFEAEILNQLDDENIQNIIYYLYANHIDYIKDILLQYLDLFLLEKDEFIKRFEKLKGKYHNDIAVILGHNLDLLEELLI